MSVESEYEAKELTAAIDRFLSALAPDDRFLFVRRYWYADSSEEQGDVFELFQFIAECRPG